MNKSTEKPNSNYPKLPEKKPNETGGFYFSSSIKIFDPETKEILVQKRGDD
jgi:hypothetical protein